MIVHEKNPRFPHTCVITRRVDDDDPMTDDDVSTVIYEGVCRSFDFHTTSETGDVLTSTRKLSLPVKQNEWSAYKDESEDESEDESDEGAKRFLIPQEGDYVVVDKGSYTESGVVIDRMPGNLGTHILWKYGRN